MSSKKSPLFVIFTTVLLDLVGFGMVIPLVGIYGRHYGASGVKLALLGAVFSLMQFFFSPFWGNLSDRFGRRPILLISLLGSTGSYLIFGLAPSFAWLFASRAFAGIFAANISTAQAYIADVTKPEERARGMGLIGAAFGIGFTLGPPLGGIASHKLGLGAPGLIAAAICGANFLLAIFRLPESLAPELRAQVARRSMLPLSQSALAPLRNSSALRGFLLIFFGATFAFSMMEQTFSLLFQQRFGFDTSDAGFRTGMVLMWSGVLGAIVQGGLIRRLAPKYGEKKLLFTGLLFNLLGMLCFAFAPSYSSYFIFVLPLTLGSALINPSVSALISKSVGPTAQGQIMGLSQSLGSLARAIGPFCGLLTFELWYPSPYLIAAGIALCLALYLRTRWQS